MDGQDAPRQNLWCPGAVVGQCRVETVAAINKNHAQACLPVECELATAGDNRYHHFFHTGLGNVVSELGKRIDLACRISQGRIMMALARLVFLRSSVMIDGVYHGAMNPRCLREP